MTNQIFFSLEPPVSERFRGWLVDDEIIEEQVICPIDQGSPLDQHRFGGYRLSPLVIKLHPHGLKDLIWTWYGELIVSEHAVEVFKAHGLTGWGLAPVTLIVKGERITQGYHELVITGWGGELSPASGVRRLERCEGCGREEFTTWTDPSRLIDPSEWDGSDFFRTYPLRPYTWVSNRAIEVLQREKMKHFTYRRVDELEPTPYGLSGQYWAPTPREEAAIRAKVLLGEMEPPPGRSGVVGKVGDFPPLI